MIIGFTGSREGMTDAQRDLFRKYMQGLISSGQTVGFPARTRIEFHQGCCLGADATATDILDKLWPADIHAHPSTLKSMTSENALRLSNTVHPPKPPLDRNRDIVNACELLVACPNGTEADNPRSGTWMTVRYARKCKKRIVIIWPDDRIEEEKVTT